MFDSASPVPLPHHLAWRTMPIPRDFPLAGYLAGPPVGVWTHHGGKVDKPCWRRFTKGALACPGCLASKLRFRGYVPLITVKGNERKVVILSKTVFTDVERLPPWTPILCQTPKQKGLASWMRRSGEPAHMSVTQKNLAKRDPECIKEYLLRVLWHVPELCEYFGTTPWNDQ